MIIMNQNYYESELLLNQNYYHRYKNCQAPETPTVETRSRQGISCRKILPGRNTTAGQGAPEPSLSSGNAAGTYLTIQVRQAEQYLCPHSVCRAFFRMLLQLLHRNFWPGTSSQMLVGYPKGNSFSSGKEPGVSCRLLGVFSAIWGERR